jgi:hypothetical protein
LLRSLDLNWCDAPTRKQSKCGIGFTVMAMQCSYFDILDSTLPILD